MPLIQGPRTFNATIQFWYKIRRKANQGLNPKENIGNQPHDRMRGLEMMCPSAGLVIFDNNKPSNEEIKSKVV